MHDRTGLYPCEFERVYQRVAPYIPQARLPSRRVRRVPTTLRSRARLFLVLTWLRCYPTLSFLRVLFSRISRQQVCMCRALWVGACVGTFVRDEQAESMGECVHLCMRVGACTSLGVRVG